MLVCSIQIISRLDSQSKFQMDTLLSDRHVGVPRRYTKMAAPYDEYRSLGKRSDFKLGEVPSISISYNMTIS